MKAFRHYSTYLFCFSILVVIAVATKPKKASAHGDFTFVQVDALEKVFQETRSFEFFDDTTDVAIGETATFQFAIRSSTDIPHVTFQISPFVSKTQDTIFSSKLCLVGYVGVGKNSPQKASDMLTSTSHLYPDPIIDKTQTYLKANVTQPIWISLDIPASTKPGEYSATITQTHQKGNKIVSTKRQIHLTVWPVRLEGSKLSISNWASLNSYRVSYDNGWKYAAHYSDEWLKLIQRIAQKMKECHSNTVMIPPLEYTRLTISDNKYSYDFSLLDKLLRVFKTSGVLKMFEGGHIAERSGGWESNYLVKVPKFTEEGQIWENLPINDYRAKLFYKNYFTELSNHMRKTFPDVHYVQHIGDEPIDYNANSYNEIAHYIKQNCPDIKLIEACHTTQVADILDILVPPLELFHKNYDFYLTQQKQGKQVWFYTAYMPQREYANRFIELPTLKTRVIHWLNYKYNATGYLHWGFNRWRGNPYKETIEDLGNNVILPGGDSWIIYPSDHHTIYGSIRLEAMRDGVADYTLLKMLEQKDRQAAQYICNEIIHDWDNYNLNIRNFRKVRRMLLQKLSDNAYQQKYLTK